PRRRGAGAVTTEDTPHVRSWLTRIEAPVNALVLPLFALANTGIRVGGSTFADGTALRIFLAVVVARVAGKPVGIAAGAALARRLLPDASVPRVAPGAVFGVGAVASIGFTVPLLIINQALAGEPAVAATAGLLVGSVLGVGLGALLLRRSRLRAGTAQPLTSPPGR
ncbi:MAG: Na+/H+ antiporter NhaA, partial [Acidimicrobiales bacterium]